MEDKKLKKEISKLFKFIKQSFDLKYEFSIIERKLRNNYFLELYYANTYISKFEYADISNYFNYDFIKELLEASEIINVHKLVKLKRKNGI